jgi:RNA polymerase sigma-70 factor (ECF subfamily)
MQAGITVDDLAISIALPSEEAALVAELQSGSERAFAELIDRYHQPLYSLIARSLQDPDAAADITQEVFLKVFRSIGGFHGESCLRTWLYRIALREASNQRRWWTRHKHQEIGLDAPCCSRCAADTEGNAQSFGSTLADGGCSPFEHAAQQELRERVSAALRQVPEAFRSVLVMREIEGFAYEEIADILQINLGTVKSRLMRGRAALRSVLAPAIGSSSSAQASVVAPAPVHDLPRVSHHLPPAERAAFHCDADRLRTQASSLPDSTLDSGLEVSQ